jgi:ABC-type nitrate/sulfonate/bicarbonate transport system ATPase subunit/ABC-type proline/glycine betaine transport system permease subunit
VLGTAAGIASGRFILLARSLAVPVGVIQGAPPLLWIVPLVLILGTGGLAPVGVVFFVVLPVVVIGVQEGVKALDPAVREMMKVYAPSRFAVLKDFYLPGLASHLRALMLTGFLIGLKSSIIGEWFGAQEGLGRYINQYFYSFDMPSFYAVALFYVLVVVALAWLAGRLGKRAFTRRVSKIDAASDTAVELVRRRARSARLDFASVSFAFGKKTVCDRIDFSLAAEKTAVLTGESGAGKTTLARLALGLLKPKAGRVSVPVNARLIFQEDAFLNHRDCFGNVVFAARTGDRAARAGRALEALRAVGLAEHALQFPDELSGGMKKRLAFARVLAADPDFIVLDEPFNKLHKKARRELWDLYFQLFAGKGIPSLIITHYPEELGRRQGLEYHEMKNGSLIRRAGRG